jgi:hypothetical protein
MDRFARLLPHALLALAVVLPFEVPLLRLGPLRITSVELVLYAVVIVWAAPRGVRLVQRPRASLASARAALQEPLVASALAWCAVGLSSAAVAPAFRAAAVKFALRSTSGVLAFFAARSAARRQDAAARLLVALAAGAAISAITALVDAAFPASFSFWGVFRAASFDALGLPRASGVFAYPTMGAMYWEAAVPLVLVAPFVLPSRTGRPAALARGAALIGVGLLLAAIVASATRSGLVGALVGCLALALVPGAGPGPRAGGATVLVGMLAVCGAAFYVAAPDSLIGQRMRWWRDGRWFGVEYAVASWPGATTVAARTSVGVTLHNTGTLTWPHGGDRPVHLGYHWEPLGREATMADFEGARTELAVDVPPGGRTTVLATVWGPSMPGPYRLCLDLVQEHTTWFSERGNPMPSQAVSVEGDPASQPVAVQGAPVTPAPPQPPSRSSLWRAAWILWRAHPLLGIGPDNFRRSYEAVVPPPANRARYEDERVHANSLYFETFADLGLVGLGVLAGLATALVLRTRAQSRAGCLVGVAAGVAAGTFFVHGLLDYFFEFTPLFGLFWLLLGLLAGAAPVRGPPPGPRGNPA